jgi:hypothetical protein
LKDWFRSLLLDERSLQRGYFLESALREVLANNNGSNDYSKEIFSLAVLELWQRVFVDNKNCPENVAIPNSLTPVVLNS